MRHRLLLVALPRPLPRCPTSGRAFSGHPSPRASSRPNVPFLALPSSFQQQLRRLGTERNRRFKYSLFLFAKYATFVVIGCCCVSAARFAVDHEVLERRYPTPPEWSYLTRCALHEALGERDRTDVPRPSYVKVVTLLKYVLDRLEDVKVDGGSDLGRVDGPFEALDISHKSEPWRRGYFEVLLALAKAAEQVEGWVKDTTRGIVFEPDLVVGPSNPNRRPIPPGSAPPPREEDCELFSLSADHYYMKLQHTIGLAKSQVLEATVSLAHWEEFKKNFDSAEAYFRIAILGLMGPSWDGNLEGKLDGWASSSQHRPAENEINLLTEYATFRARNFDAAAVLPLFVNLLKVRRNLAPPSPDTVADQYKPPERWTVRATAMLKSVFTPQAYPPPPPDGSAPPLRDARCRCEEAALAMHIGEILFASDTKAREGAVGWTRDAVDAAEEQLRGLEKVPSAAAGKETAVAQSKCRACLGAGLDTWAAMTRVLAGEEDRRREKAEQQEAKASSWFSLWGGDRSIGDGRWGAEEKLVVQRRARAKDLLEEPTPPRSILDSIKQVWSLSLS